MNEDHPSDRTARRDDRDEGAADGTDVTRADETDARGAPSGREVADRTPAGEASAAGEHRRGRLDGPLARSDHRRPEHPGRGSVGPIAGEG